MTPNKLDQAIGTNLLYLLESEAELATSVFTASSRASFGDILFIYFVNSKTYCQDSHSEPPKSAYFHL